MLPRVIILITQFLFLSQVIAESGKVWEVEALPNHTFTSKERILRSPNLPNSHPQKIRLVNYEQRHLARQQQRFGSEGSSYLEAVRQKMRGTTTKTAQQPVPIPTSAEAITDESRLPDLDSLHKARQLFETRKDGSTLAPMSELEIKADHQLQKSMQRTTQRTKIYPTEDAIDADTNNSEASVFSPTTPLPTSTSPLASSSTHFPTFAPFPAFPNLTQPNFGSPAEIPSFPQPPNPPPVLGLQATNISTTPQPQFEQLGCGFDFLTNTCKDMFGIGWCDTCEDFGNIFLHDCKCTLPSQRYHAFNSTRLPEVATLPTLPNYPQQAIGLQPPPTLPIHSSAVIGLQSPTNLADLNNQNRSLGLQNFFVHPRFFGFL